MEEYGDCGNLLLEYVSAVRRRRAPAAGPPAIVCKAKSEAGMVGKVKSGASLEDIVSRAIKTTCKNLELLKDVDFDKPVRPRWE